MNILITGAGGMLGLALRPALARKGHNVFATDLVPTTNSEIEYLDVKSYAQISEMVKKTKPDMLMHLAAETDVDRCELEPDHAFLTNTIGTQYAALVCQRQNIPMVYISTIGVFYGDKAEPYIEFDEPNPINVYGKSKLEGEKIVQNLLEKYYIVRAGWMIGGGPEKDKKFVGKIIRRMADTKALKAVNDKVGSPTYTVDFSACLSDLIETGYYGLYHCTNKGYGSRFDVASKIVEFMDRSDITVEPVSSAFFPLPAARAKSEMSRNYKLDLLGMNKAREWTDALKEYLDLYWK
jgi:dTDP-4-dehydrorhamnose reductase